MEDRRSKIEDDGSRMGDRKSRYRKWRMGDGK
jgi:hypothetical protein